MSDDLFFIPIINKALRQPDQAQSLKEAFGQIEKMASEKRYQRGYQQFCSFMNELGLTQQKNTFKEIEQKLIAAFERPDVFDITIEKDGELLGKLSFTGEGSDKDITGIKPGNYCLRLDSGLCIWEGKVTKQDVQWLKAYPDQSLPMAADTDDFKHQPTRIEKIFNGAVILRFYAGIVSGSMQIEIKKWSFNDHD